MAQGKQWEWETVVISVLSFILPTDPDGVLGTKISHLPLSVVL